MEKLVILILMLLSFDVWFLWLFFVCICVVLLREPFNSCSKMQTKHAHCAIGGRVRVIVVRTYWSIH